MPPVLVVLWATGVVGQTWLAWLLPAATQRPGEGTVFLVLVATTAAVVAACVRSAHHQGVVPVPPVPFVAGVGWVAIAGTFVLLAWLVPIVHPWDASDLATLLPYAATGAPGAAAVVTPAVLQRTARRKLAHRVSLALVPTLVAGALVVATTSP
ncbi:hypothetical protein ACFUMH_03685 [Cellulomonas sp. NPDC057328]|uniref:hypothetical protein n=1 Tax=Cellulomonas sp. NPDC057328 TaxID=3346101 RepID=UPI00363CDE0E